MKVLMAATEPNCAILQEMVTEYGYHAITTSSALEARMILQSETDPIVLILDRLLPGADSAELCEKLIKNKANNPGYTILLIPADGKSDIAAGFAAGADDYLTTPIDADELRTRLGLGKRILEYQASLEKLKREVTAKDDELNQLAALDGLTGIPNRDFFKERFAEEWRRALRLGQPVSLLMLDIDFFKVYNETYGHLAGDECLKMVSSIIVSSISRSGDFVARYSGEEFAVVLPSTDSLGSLVIAEAIRVAVAIQDLKHLPDGINGRVTVSIGTATVIPHRNMQPGELIIKAEQSLALAKASGRNTVRQAV